jgi:alpha-tubulin suppressor-like RCC1 family protein
LVGWADEGRVFACGWNYFGQLGIGNSINQTLPVEIESLRYERIVAIDSRGKHCMALSGTLPVSFNQPTND